MAKNQCTLPDPNKGNGRTGWEMVQMQLISVQNQWNFAQTRWSFKDADFRFYKRQETRKCARFLLLPLRLLQASVLEDAVAYLTSAGNGTPLAGVVLECVP